MQVIIYHYIRNYNRDYKYNRFLEFKNFKKQWVDILYDLSQYYAVNCKPKKPFFSEAMEYGILLKKHK